MAMTVEQFGQSVKAKYPQYANIPDAELGTKTLEKYPQYKNRVNVSQPQLIEPLTAENQVKKDNFFQGLLRPLAEVGTGLVNAGEATVDLLKGDNQGAAEALHKERSVPLLGTTKPFATGDETTGEAAKKMLGYGAEFGSYLTVPGTGKALGLGLKGLVKQGAKQGIKEGVFGGATSLGGRALQEDKSYKEAGIEALKGAAGGAVGGAIFRGALPLVGAGVNKVGLLTKGLQNKTAERTINSLIKPLMKDLSYGKNPAQGILKEGIIFNSLEEGAQKVGQGRQKIGEEIGHMLSSPESLSKRLDVSDVLSPIDDAIKTAVKNGDNALYQRLNTAKQQLTHNFVEKEGQLIPGQAKKLVDITPQEAWQVKKTVGDITKFTGNASDDKTVNQALKRVYGKLKQKINVTVPQLKELNERYANLTSADIAIRYRDKIASRQNLLSIVPKGLTMGGLLTGAVTLNPAIIAGTLATAGAEKILGSAAFKTRLAKFLYKATPAEIEVLKKSTPILLPVLNQLGRVTAIRLTPALIQAELDKLVPPQTAIEPSK